MEIMCLNGCGGKLYEALLPYPASKAHDILCELAPVSTGHLGISMEA